MLSDVGFRLAVEAADIEGTLLFALLHDVGHYPLSHMFEDFRGRETARNDSILLDDDLFGPLINADGEDLIGTVIRKKLDRGQSLSNLISQYFGAQTLEALWSIANCANGSTRPNKRVHRVLSGLVSSAIDLDKVAYLLADSVMSGVNYGRGIDLQGFFTALLDPLASSSASEENETGPIIGIDEKGLAAAESIILARYWMLSRVYWHHTNRALMAAFKFAISELVSAGKLDFSKYFMEVFWSGEVEALKYLSKEFATTWKNARMNPLEGLINGRRGIYKRLITISHQQEQDLHNKLISRDDTAATNAATTALESILTAGRVKRGMIIVDIPRRTRDTIRLEEIRILGDPEAGEQVNNRSLKEASPLLNKLHEEFLNEVKKSRVFIHPATYEVLRAESKLDAAREEVRRALSNKLE
jgi:HD superfamily phosphohydrolase